MSLRHKEAHLFHPAVARVQLLLGAKIQKGKGVTMTIQNKTMLITYSDSLGKNLKELNENLGKYFGEAVGGVHLLPFFPSTGDRGFAPVDYDEVDAAFGDWDDVKALGEKYYLMFDFMINHISRQSKYYKDYQEKHEASAYKDMFLNWDKFWPENRPTQADVDLIYKRKDRAPKQGIHFADGSVEHLWNTFGEEQIDLDVTKDVTMDFIRKTIAHLAENGCDLIRLDAFAYAVKKLDTNDFFVEPEIWELLDKVRSIAAESGTELLPEIHEHYSIQFKMLSTITMFMILPFRWWFFIAFTAEMLIVWRNGLKCLP